MNRNNLKALSSYLLKGDLQAQFHMSKYSEHGVDLGHTTCGTIGCAVGHGPFVDISMSKLLDENWNDYCTRVFGIQNHEDEWDWCFGGEWVNTDNSPMGAAKRINYLLENGSLPEGFESDYADEDDGEAENSCLEKYVSIYGGTLNEY